jgi:aminopeptidase YwaD
MQVGSTGRFGRVTIEGRIAEHLSVLVERIGARPPGSPANRHATDYITDVLRATRLLVEAQPFDARWWEPGPAALDVDGLTIDIVPTPFSQPCDVAGPVRRISSDAELERAGSEPGKILVIEGELTAEPFFPKAFPFLDLPEQRTRIIRLEGLRPLAVVAIVEGMGAYSIFEDGDLTFPYLAVPPALGDRLAEDAWVRVRIAGALHEGPGVNVSARSGGPGRRVVVSAHMDSKGTTPGAFDNAGGVAVLLAVAESGVLTHAPVELVFFNGEDHYAAPGERVWFAGVDLSTIRLAINLDGAGVVGRGSTVASLACPPAIEERLREVVASRPGWRIVAPWYESDHSIFAMRGVPSLAITSDGVHELLRDVAHTERDTLEVVDPAILVDVAGFVTSWLADGT